MKRLIIVMMLFVSGQLFAQLDSAAIVSVINVPVEVLDTNETEIIYSELSIQTYINDYDFFGEILLVVKDVENDYPLIMKKLTKVEIENLNLFNSGSKIISITLPIYSIVEIMEIQVVVRNYQGGNLPYQYYTLNN